MKRIKEAIEYLGGPYNVSDFQRFCGVEIYKDSEEKRHVTSDKPNPEINGVVQQHGETGKPADLSGLKHRLNKNGYSKIENGHLNDAVQAEATKNGYSCLYSDNKNGFVTSKNGIDVSTANRLAELESEQTESKLTYRIKYKPLHYLFHLGASLGNEIFYLICFPLMMWNLDSVVLRQTAIVWHAGMYLGQALKDVIKRPRPASPPVARLEERYAKEYGMPSTHAMVGAIIPFCLFITSLNRYQYPFALGLCVALSWTILVGLSRIYLGMHCALDVICGLLAACVLMPCMIPFIELFDHLQVTHPMAPIVTVLGSFLVCFVYPPLVQWSTARGDTATVHGIGSGISFGSWLNYNLGWMTTVATRPAPVPVPGLSLHTLYMIILRTSFGVVVLVLCKIVLKKWLIGSLCYIHNTDKNDIDGMRKKRIEIPLKFFTYFWMSVAASCCIPAMLNYLGLMRQGFYSEVTVL